MLVQSPDTGEGRGRCMEFGGGHYLCGHGVGLVRAMLRD